MNEQISIPIGIINVLWDYDEYNDIKKAFYELSIINNNNEFEFKNNYYFLDNELFSNMEDTSTKFLEIIILDLNYENKIKIQICGDILFITKKQYNLLNEKITKLQDKYNFNMEIINNIETKTK